MAHQPAKPGTVHIVTSAEDFQFQLSQDLGRVSLLNFYAPITQSWKEVNGFVERLARTHPSVLVLQIQAEEQEDISESFDIQAVPVFIVLRGHVLLAKMEDHTKLEDTIITHTSAKQHIHPRSSTIQSPASPPKQETREELFARLSRLVNQDKVMLFMKGTPDSPRCGFSRQIVQILNDHNVKYSSFDIFSDDNVRSGLKEFNSWPTFPQLMINGEFVGGLDVVRDMVETGEFRDLLVGVSS